jgi:hypothetical protein
MALTRLKATMAVMHYLTLSLVGREKKMTRFEEWRALHCRTNGLSTDILNSIVRLCSPRPQFDTVAGIAGTLSPERRRSIVDVLSRDGIYVFPDRLDETLVSELRQYAFSTPSAPYPLASSGPELAIYDPDAPLAPTYWHSERNLFSNATIQKIVADPSLVALAADYLKVVPKLAILALWHSSHRFADASSHGAQMYHFDLSFPQWVNLFIFLSDVDLDSGPHAYLKGTHRRDTEGAPLRARGIQRISDEDILQTYGRNKLVEVCGQRGTMFMADTRGWHKCIKTQRADRLVFQIV